MKQATKRGLTPKLRFPEYRDAGEWETKELADLIRTVTPPKKIPTTQFSESGLFPIIDQSQAYISGWTDDQDAVISNGLPLIIFGDHTCVLKITDAPFVQGADGIKIFGASPGLSTTFLYQHLLFNPVKMEEYKRHFAILKSKIIAFPDETSGEQQKIADCLSSIDELVAAQTQKLDTLKSHKNGLMQQLFPREGETQPRLRFPEFQAAGEWASEPLGELGEIVTGKTPSTKESDLWGGDILFITPTDISEDDKYQHTTARTVVETKSTKILPAGSVVYTCIASIGKMALTVHPSITNQQINAVVPNEKALGAFIYYALANLTPWIKTIPATSTLPIINKTDFSKIAILHPEDKAEQQRIADSLTSLDDLIAAQTQKLATLKSHKKGLKQQLFPALDEVKG